MNLPSVTFFFVNSISGFYEDGDKYKWWCVIPASYATLENSSVYFSPFAFFHLNCFYILFISSLSLNSEFFFLMYSRWKLICCFFVYFCRVEDILFQQKNFVYEKHYKGSKICFRTLSSIPSGASIFVGQILVFMMHLSQNRLNTFIGFKWWLKSWKLSKYWSVTTPNGWNCIQSYFSIVEFAML